MSRSAGRSRTHSDLPLDKTYLYAVSGVPVADAIQVPALNFPQFGRILYMQTNLSAALCAIRSGGERSGLTAHFFFGVKLAGFS
jgi:hypothetical protein